MPRANPLQATFNAGELSPRMAARVDFAKYPNGCNRLENMVPLPQGGAMRRAGTRYIAETKDSSKRSRLMGFEFSTEQAYIIEFGAAYLRFYKDRGQIVVAATDAAVANGTFDSGLAGWSDRSTGTAAISHDAVNGRLSLDGAAASVAWAEQAITTTAMNDEHVVRFRVLAAAGDKIELRVGTASSGSELVADTEFGVGYHCFAFTPTASPFYLQFRNAAVKTTQIDDVSLIDNAPLELDTPYGENELFQIKGAQSADTMYLVHQAQPVFRLTRSSHTSWSLSEVGFEDGPWLAENATATTLVAAAGTGLGIAVTASADLFMATDVGRLLRLKNGSAWGWAVITGFTDARGVTADARGTTALPTVATASWRLGAWSAGAGYPCAVAFYEQRLWLAGSRKQPQTLWGSQSADFESMKPDDGSGTVEADDALDYTISADQVNAVQWLSPGNELACGTTGGEWMVRATTLGEPVTPTNLQIKRQTTHGSAGVAPLRVGHVVLFLQRQARKLLELAFNFESNGFRAPDLTILSDQVTRGGICDMAFQQEPDSSVWCVRNDGVLACMTYKREQDVVAWSRHILGGAFASGTAVGESVAVIPGNGTDETWVLCKRTINGATRRYVESFEPAFENGGIQADAFYVDSGLTYNGAATTTITGLGHLEAQTVAILADGAVHPTRTVSGGGITLQKAASKVQVGLGYKHLMETLRVEAGAPAGTATGQTKRVHGVTLVLLDSLNAKIGPSSGMLDAVPFRAVSDSMDTSIPLFSGEKRIDFAGDYDTDTRIVIEGDDPAPFTLLALAPRLKTNET